MSHMIRRAPREIAYCAISAAHGFAGLGFLAWWLIPSAGLIMTVIGTVVGLVLMMGALTAARLLGGLQRWFLAWLTGTRVEPPPPFSPGSGVLGRVEARLRDRAAWRAVGYLAARLPLAAFQFLTAGFAVSGVIDVFLPALWPVVHPHSRPVSVPAPVPLGDLTVSTWPGTFAVCGLGLAFVALAVPLGRVAVFADTRLIRALLGPGVLTERVRELERTRALAVDNAAAALRRVERDLHDGAQVRLAALTLHLGMARDKAAGDAPDLGALRGLLDDAQADAQGALSDLRDLARGIHPPVLDNGLPEALESLAAATAIPVTVTVPADLPRPSAAIETIAYFCAAELVTNAAKHSYANTVGIGLAGSGRTLVLSVTDDGVGGADPARGTGLAGLAERAAMVDGMLRVASPPGGPTLATVELPLEA